MNHLLMKKVKKDVNGYSINLQPNSCGSVCQQNCAWSNNYGSCDDCGGACRYGCGDSCQRGCSASCGSGAKWD